MVIADILVSIVTNYGLELANTYLFFANKLYKK